MRAIWPAILPALSTGAFIASAIALPQAASAHHSFSEFNTQSRPVAIEGDITEIRWRNPHVMVQISVRNPAGQIETWDLEMESLGMLRRMGVGPDVMAVGDHITIAGSPAYDGSRRIYAQNVLLPSGAELVMRGGPLFSNQTVGNLSNWTVQGTAQNPDAGLFRVWSTTMTSLLTPVVSSTQNPATLLTPAAQSAIASFDPIATSRLAGCKHPGVPRIMQQPDDLAFVDQGEEILLQIEEFDTVRHIDMTPDADRAQKPLSTLGYSTGAWDGRTLVVTTDRIAEPAIQWTLPQSDQAEIVERFTPSEDGSRLDYELTVTDPVYMTEPLLFTKYWVAIEGTEIDPYDCAE